MQKLILIITISLFSFNGIAFNNRFSGDSLVNLFYSTCDCYNYWDSSNKHLKRAIEWLNLIERSMEFGLPYDNILINRLRTTLRDKKSNRISIRSADDKLISRLVLYFIRDVNQGNLILDYDEISKNHNTLYVQQLLEMTPRSSVKRILRNFECIDSDYRVLKEYLEDSAKQINNKKFKSVCLAMNYRRYISSTHEAEYIVVNIPETELLYYRLGQNPLRMRAVVGKKANPTPLIASYISSIVTFPVWNIPYSIAVNEIIPKIKHNSRYLEQQSIELFDDTGNQIDDTVIKWDDYNAVNFPFYFRQSSGPENSLGVIKFNFNNPYSIFLHSTSNSKSFELNYRFLSHGCVRLENPLELADALLWGKIDIPGLINGKANAKTETIELPFRIQLYIIYVPVIVSAKSVIFLDDVYGLIQ